MAKKSQVPKFEFREWTPEFITEGAIKACRDYHKYQAGLYSIHGLFCRSTFPVGTIVRYDEIPRLRGPLVVVGYTCSSSVVIVEKKSRHEESDFVWHPERGEFCRFFLVEEAYALTPEMILAAYARRGAK